MSKKQSPTHTDTKAVVEFLNILDFGDTETDDRNSRDAETSDEESSNFILCPLKYQKTLLFLCFQDARNRTLVEIS